MRAQWQVGSTPLQNDVVHLDQSQVAVPQEPLQIAAEISSELE